MRKHNKTTAQLKDEEVQWIRDYFKENGPETTTVIGISGGKDSSVVAASNVEARGIENTFGVIMPNGTQHDIDYSRELCEILGIRNIEINIQPIAEAFANTVCTALAKEGLALSDQAVVNFPARLRMAVLYAVAQSLPAGGRVANTCNLSEDYVGYATKFGDGAGDFSPLSHLTVTEVLAIGKELGLPEKFTDKVPEDGLSGLTDEENLGFAYERLDTYIDSGTTGDAVLDEVIRTKHSQNLHKLELMPTYNPG